MATPLETTYLFIVIIRHANTLHPETLQAGGVGPGDPIWDAAVLLLSAAVESYKRS